MSNSKVTVLCPHCKKTVFWNNKNAYRPFCSKRCQLIDFNDWSSENHRISGEKTSHINILIDE